jgi:hypothetical protein
MNKSVPVRRMCPHFDLPPSNGIGGFAAGDGAAEVDALAPQPLPSD